MRHRIAWTLTATLAVSVVGRASGQGAQSPSPRKQITAGPTTARPQAGTPTPTNTPTRQPAPADPEAIRARQAADLKAKAAMVPILAEWEKQSRKVVNLSVPFERVDKSAAWGDEYFSGRAVLKAPNLACLEFKKCKLDPEGKPLTKPNANGDPAWVLEPEPTERVVCTGKEVLQYDYAKKAVYVFPLDKEARMKALQEGPLPFLFNMKADEATRRYGMRLLQEDDREYLIAIVPNDPSDRSNFERAFLWLSKANFLPNRLRLYPVQSGKDQLKEAQEFTFHNIDTTRPIESALFNPPMNMPGWKTIVNPPDGGKAADARVNAAGPAAQPAAVIRRQATQPALPKAGLR